VMEEVMAAAMAAAMAGAMAAIKVVGMGGAATVAEMVAGVRGLVRDVRGALMAV